MESATSVLGIALSTLKSGTSQCVTDTPSQPHATSTSDGDSTPKAADGYAEKFRESERQLSEQRSSNELLVKQMEQLVRSFVVLQYNNASFTARPVHSIVQRL